MSSLSMLSVLVLYPLTLLGDGCIVIAIALAATVGGRPLAWGASFALFHALYGVIGILVANEITGYSESLGHVFVLIGTLILLKHFVHHSLHHKRGGDCSCEHHTTPPASMRAILSTASAFSLHSLASGAIISGMASGITNSVLVLVLVALSLIIGLLVAGIVYIGDRERQVILNKLDRLPGVVATILTAMCCFAGYQLAENYLSSSRALQGLAWLVGLVISGGVGWWVHGGRKVGNQELPGVRIER